jgi:methionine-rich copper-binding protein CopC
VISTSRQHALTAIGTVAVALGLVLGAAAPAAAHNYVVSSTPADGEILTAVPEMFVITTNDILLNLSGEATGFGMLITDETGAYYGDGCVTVDGRSMSTAAALGPAGDYTLTFQLISADGHTLSDSLSFRYEPRDGASADSGSTSAPVCPGRSGTIDGENTPGTDASADPIDESAVVLAIIGVSVGVLALVAAIVAVMMARSRRSSGDDDTNDTDTNDTDTNETGAHEPDANAANTPSDD